MEELTTIIELIRTLSAVSVRGVNPMKRIFVIMSLLFILTNFLSAQEQNDKKYYIQPVLGVGISAPLGPNVIGFTTGFDTGFKVWQNKGRAPGNMFIGISTGFRYWVPVITGDSFDSHIFSIPLAGNFAYEFKVANEKALKFFGLFLKVGIVFNIFYNIETWGGDYRYVTYGPAFLSGLGMIYVFKNDWTFSPVYTFQTEGIDKFFFGDLTFEVGCRF